MSDLFSSADFMPHGHCYLWLPSLLWLHVGSDMLVALAYTTIPVTMAYLLRKRRKDIPFNWIYFCFAVFIIACGLTHYIEVWTVWHPDYWLAGAVKAVTAAASVATAVLLVRLVPQVLALPSPGQYREAYEAANQSRAAYRALLEASLDAFFVLTVAGDGFVIADCNATAERDAGMPRDRLVGRALAAAVPVELAACLAPLLAAVSAEKTGRVEVLDLTIGGQRTWLAIQVAPMPDGVGLSMRDISEARRASERVRLSEERMRFVVNNAPIALFALDREGRYLLSEGRALERLGFAPGELVGRSVHEVYPPDSPAMALYDRALSGAEHAEHVQVGDTILESHAVPHRGPDGAVDGVLGVSIDVTARVHAERELRQLNDTLEHRVHERTQQLQVANAELETFAYSVAHDLRSPLRAVDGYAATLSDRISLTTAPENLEHLARIRAGAQRMSALIDALLALSRVTRAGLIREDLDLSEMARQIAEELRSRQPDRPAGRVDVLIEPGLRARGDRHLVRLVLENLLDNAFKFTTGLPAQDPIDLTEAPAPARIWFTAELEGPGFVVRDTGVGFSMEEAGELFMPFHRLHGRQAYPGTGIGLATVKRILARHGGTIWATSAPGCGAAFHFTIPDGAFPRGDGASTSAR